MYSIIFCGVGGQGILTLGGLTGKAFIMKGYEVRLSEVHGLSQRGGSVVVHLRAGKSVFSPLIPINTADAIVSLEAVETIRYIDYISPNGLILMNKMIIPPSVLNVSLPEINEIISSIKILGLKIYVIDGLKIIEELKESRILNTAMLGAMCRLKIIPHSLNELEEVIREYFPEKYIDINIRALRKGYESL